LDEGIRLHRPIFPQELRYPDNIATATRLGLNVNGFFDTPQLSNLKPLGDRLDECQMPSEETDSITTSALKPGDRVRVNRTEPYTGTVLRVISPYSTIVVKPDNPKFADEWKPFTSDIDVAKEVGIPLKDEARQVIYLHMDEVEVIIDAMPEFEPSYVVNGADSKAKIEHVIEMAKTMAQTEASLKEYDAKLMEDLLVASLRKAKAELPLERVKAIAETELSILINQGMTLKPSDITVRFLWDEKTARWSVIEEPMEPTSQTQSSPDVVAKTEEPTIIEDQEPKPSALGTILLGCAALVGGVIGTVAANKPDEISARVEMQTSEIDSPAENVEQVLTA
jgi:hypothetical protein